ncbi:MAG TPA: c-type cytochrome [Candidatus Methylomirabilis sp.]|nr:c-type cytochrome [Candidatus Methylomirabilis sp.]
MRRRFPVLGVVLILVGAGGLAWLSALGGGPWLHAPWQVGPWGAGRFFTGPGMMPGFGPGMMAGPGWWPGKQSFASNGERIYYTGISAGTGPIPTVGGPMWIAHGGAGCVACHGVHGQGGIPVMMGSAIPEDIRYAVLTGKQHAEGDEKMDHPPYTDPLIKRAITQGVDPAGMPLDWTMPRWQMSDADFSDLLAYLKTLR